jgi:hypothetical protein
VPADAFGGSWFYDEVRKELVYVPNLKRHLVADPGDPSAVTLRFRLHMLEGSAGGHYGISLRPVVRYRWEP